MSFAFAGIIYLSTIAAFVAVFGKDEMFIFRIIAITIAIISLLILRSKIKSFAKIIFEENENS